MVQATPTVQQLPGLTCPSPTSPALLTRAMSCPTKLQSRDHLWSVISLKPCDPILSHNSPTRMQPVQLVQKFQQGPLKALKNVTITKRGPMQQV
jgi:hypothetical protein